jgi:hypothetical protein
MEAVRERLELPPDALVQSPIHVQLRRNHPSRELASTSHTHPHMALNGHKPDHTFTNSALFRLVTGISPPLGLRSICRVPPYCDDGHS